MNDKDWSTYEEDCRDMKEFPYIPLFIWFLCWVIPIVILIIKN